MKKNILILVGSSVFAVVAAVNLALLTPVSAITVGVSPNNIQNEQILPGSTVSIPFTFFLSEHTEDMKIVVSSELPEFEDWVSFLPGKEFTYSVGEKSATITVVVKVPANAVIKTYDGFIRVNANTIGASNVNNAVISGSRLGVHLSLTTKQLEDTKITSAMLEEASYNRDLALILNINNAGNVKAQLSKAILTIFKVDGTAITTLSSSQIEAVDSFTTKKVTVNFPHQLLPGQYDANLQVFSGEKVIYQEKLVLNVAQTNDVIPNVKVFLDKNLLVVLSLLILAAVVTIILVLRFYGSKPSKAAAAIALFSLLPTLGLIGYLGYLIGQYQQLDSMINERSAAQVKSETAKQPKLLGVETDKPAAQANESATAVSGFYKIFETADVNSKVIYYAKEKEVLHAVEDIADWYKVELPDKSFGYLPKRNVVTTSK